MIEITEYIAKKTSYDARTTLFISDMIDALIRSGLPYKTRKDILRYALNDNTFTDKEIECFAMGEAPALYEIVPVDVSVVRGYRIHVKVPKGSDSNMVKTAAKEQIINYGLEESELDPCLDIERDDIMSMNVDWDGVQDDE